MHPKTGVEVLSKDIFDGSNDCALFHHARRTTEEQIFFGGLRTSVQDMIRPVNAQLQRGHSRVIVHKPCSTKICKSEALIYRDVGICDVVRVILDGGVAFFVISAPPPIRQER